MFFLLVNSWAGTYGTYRRLNVLSFYRRFNIACCKVKLSQFFRVQPDAHGIFRAVFIYGRYTFNALNSVDKVNVGVCSEEHTVISIVRRGKCEIHDGFRRFLRRGNAVCGYFLRHGAGCLRYTVLYFYRSNIGILFQVKLYVQTVFAGSGTGRTHIQHIFYAVYLLLYRLRNRFFYRLGTCARIVGSYGNTRLSNIRILGNRQAETGNSAQQRNQYGQHHGKDWTVNKKSCHSAYLLILLHRQHRRILFCRR